MKSQTVIKLFTLFCLAMSFKTQAQLGDNTFDPRIKTQLEALGLKYEINSRGNFKVIFNMGQERTQLVLINSNTYEYGGMEIREITSVASVVDTRSDFNQSSLFKLLELNETYKLGFWQINGGKSPFMLQYAVRISANSTQSVLDDVIRLAAKVADEMEQKFTSKDDY